jgi:hypothetical protein
MAGFVIASAARQLTQSVIPECCSFGQEQGTQFLIITIKNPDFFIHFPFGICGFIS